MFKDKIKRCKLIICLNVILAFTLGIFAQDIAGYLAGDTLSGYVQLYWLTSVTILSILLFLVTPVLSYIFFRKSENKRELFVVYVIPSTFVGIFTSLFSLFVLIMTWG